MKILVNGKRISRAEADKRFGKERMDRRVAEAVEAHREDPWELISWMDGMVIEF